MKRKGFTLIELLAVIVVLAVIALIATPIVTKTLKSAKKGATERSADNYINGVELAISTSEINRKLIPDGEYSIDNDGNLIGTDLPDGKLEIEMDGNKPTSGIIVIKNGEVTTDSKMTIGEYGVSYDESLKRYIATEPKKYNNGEIVYFNVTTGSKCSSSDYTETQSNTGVKEGCMKFYAFNDDGGAIVKLILDHNTTIRLVWNSSGSNVNGPKEVLEQLKKDTSSWKGTETPENYTVDQSGSTGNVNYTIDYSSYKARLITAQEIAQIVGNTAWDEKNATTWYYLDSKTSDVFSTCKSGNTSGCQYGWLYDRTNTNCTKYGCLNDADSSMNGTGYWTATSRAGLSDVAWYLTYTGRVYDSRTVDSENFYGVRPVIEVLKFRLD